jgi:hypothetical protein
MKNIFVVPLTTKKFVVCVLLLVFAVCSPLSADDSFSWDLGWESTVFTQGVTARVSSGSMAVNVAAHYSFIGAIVERILDDEEALLGISRLGLVSASVTKSFVIGERMQVALGPKMYGLTAGLRQFILGAAGVDLVFEFRENNQMEGLRISGFIPFLLIGDDLGFDSNPAWAWDVFGFAISPTVGYFWTY